MDAFACERQFVDHLVPVWRALPPEARGTFHVDASLLERAAAAGVDAVAVDADAVRRSARVPEAKPPRGRQALVASIGDTKVARRLGYGNFARLEHGIGQTYIGNMTGSYAGGPDNLDASLVLVPNDYAAAHWRATYPNADVRIVGCPKLDTLPEREPGPLTIAVTFHWMCAVVPETQPALDDFAPVLAALAQRFRVIGHSHPKGDWPRTMQRLYRRFGIPYVAEFEDVCRQADLLVFDNTSAGYEFAATGRPVVVLNSSRYRRNVHHGLRFWDAANVGVNVDRPDDLIPAVERALADPPGVRADRETALSLVYPVRRDGARLAAAAVSEWAGLAVAA